ncbi:MAG: acetolactate decarboxylase [Burkholderiales bacterium]
MKKKLHITFIGLLLAATVAWAAEPFAVQAWGNFKQMSHTGNTAGVVKLSALGNAKGSYGVGAIAGMRGEILQWDGRLLVSRGHSHKGETGPASAGDEAVLFVQAKVVAWQEVPVAADMTQPQFEAFVVNAAKKAGLDSDKAFPFAVRGNTTKLVWHVVTGTPQGVHHGSGTHQQGHAQSRVFREDSADGTLLGFYTGAALEGIASHPGERFHVHYANPDFTAAGHVDEYRITKGSNLLLPKP